MFFVVGETLTFTDTANIDGTYAWALVDEPDEQSSTLGGAATDTATLVIDPNTEGQTYKLRATRTTTTGDEIGELLFAVSIVGLFAGARFPGYLEQDDTRAGATEATWNAASNTKGWHRAAVDILQRFVRQIRAYLKPDVSGAPVVVNLPAIDSTIDGGTHVVIDALENATANNVTITPDGSDTIATAPNSLLIDADGGAVTLIPDSDTSTWFVAGGQGYTAT
jgi:hypothetical protein